MASNLGRMVWWGLPYEMINEIVSWLPVNSLLRFKFMCKQWFHLITNPDPHFLKTHLKQLFRSKPGILVLGKNVQETDTQFYYAEDYTSCNTLTRFANPFPRNNYRIVNICNGLVCFQEYGYNAYVWNPITGDHITIPPCSSNPSYLLPGVDGFDDFRQVDIVYGFGFDPVSDVYKVIRFVSSPPHEFGGDSDSHVTVYTLGRDSSWRILPKIPYNICFDNYSTALLNGVLYWFAQMLYESVGWNSPKEFLVAFKIQEETFEEIPQPDDISSDNMLNKKVGVLDGLLSIFCSLENEYFIGVDIWVMGIYGVADSWRKHCRIVELVGSGRYMRLLGDADSRDIIISRDTKELFSYDLETDSLRKLHKFDNHDDSHVWETHLFKGSLLSPTKLFSRPAT